MNEHLSITVAKKAFEDYFIRSVSTSQHVLDQELARFEECLKDRIRQSAELSRNTSKS